MEAEKRAVITRPVINSEQSQTRTDAPRSVLRYADKFTDLKNWYSREVQYFASQSGRLGDMDTTNRMGGMRTSWTSRDSHAAQAADLEVANSVVILTDRLAKT